MSGSTADPREFISAYSPLAQSISASTGIDPANVLGVMALETGWGRNMSGNNAFGVSDPQGKTKATYPTLTDNANHFVNLMNNSVYRLVGQAAPEQQLNLLADLGWNRNPKYGDTVNAVAQTVRRLQNPLMAASDGGTDAGR